MTWTRGHKDIWNGLIDIKTPDMDSWTYRHMKWTTRGHIDTWNGLADIRTHDMDPWTYRHMDALTQSIECIVCCISWIARWLEDETDCQYLYCCDIFHTGKCEAQWEVGSWIRHSHCNLWALLLPCRWYWQTFHSQRNNKARMSYCCQRLIFSILRFLS